MTVVGKIMAHRKAAHQHVMSCKRAALRCLNMELTKGSSAGCKYANQSSVCSGTGPLTCLLTQLVNDKSASCKAAHHSMAAAGGNL